MLKNDINGKIKVLNFYIFNNINLCVNYLK